MALYRRYKDKKTVVCCDVKICCVVIILNDVYNKLISVALIKNAVAIILSVSIRMNKIFSFNFTLLLNPFF